MAEGGGFFLESQHTDVDTHQTEPRQSQEESSQGFIAFHVGRRDGHRNPGIQNPEGQGPTRSGCSHCVSLSYSEDLYKAFGVYICGACRKNVKMISKVGFASEYYLF